MNGDTHTADRANDGNHNPNVNAGSCIVTHFQDPEPNPWWTVDLGMPMYVHSVIFTNRDTYGMYDIFHIDLTRNGSECTGWAKKSIFRTL